MSSPPRAVAIVKLSALGDVVHTTPLLEALADAIPGARLTWVVERREAAFGRKALNFAIITAVLVMAILIGLMVFSATQR